jgi:hypothetical protein
VIKVSLTAVTDGAEWSVLPEGDTGQEYEPGCVCVFDFENIPRNTLTYIQARNKIAEFNLTPDSMGRYNIDAYAMANAATYMLVHCERLVKSQGGSEAQTYKIGDGPGESGLDWIVENIPEPVLITYFRRSNPGVKTATVKKRQPASNTGAAAGQSGENPSAAPTNE